MADYEVPTDAYNNEVVTRCAPRWAWNVIDWHVDKRMNSNAVFRNIREELVNAHWAMKHASENPELTHIGKIPVAKDPP